MQKQKLDIKNLSVKQKKKLHIYLRATIQLLYFILLPSAFTAAFGGVKYIFTQIGLGKEVELTSFVTVLIVLCLYTIVFGRFFSGFACAFGTLGDAACTKKCSSDIGLPCKGSLEGRGDCFQCQKCIDICPKSNIHCGIHELKGNEVLFTLFRAILLFCLLMWIGL